MPDASSRPWTLSSFPTSLPRASRTLPNGAQHGTKPHVRRTTHSRPTQHATLRSIVVASDAQTACDDPNPPYLAACRVIYRLPPLCDSALCVRVIVAVTPVSSSLASSAWADIVEIHVDGGWRVAPAPPQTYSRTQQSGDFLVLLVFRPQGEDVLPSASSAYSAAFRRSRERHGEKCVRRQASSTCLH